MGLRCRALVQGFGTCFWPRIAAQDCNAALWVQRFDAEQGMGFGVQGFAAGFECGVSVQDLGCRALVQDFGCGILLQGFGCRILDAGFWV